MKITPEREELLKRWAYKAWEIHWKELAPKSNSRAQFVKYVIRDNPDNDKLKEVQLAIDAQTRHWRRQNKIERVIGIPCLSVWYNQGRYEDEFIDESAMDMKIREESKKCACGKDVHGQSFKYCSDCMPTTYSGNMLKAMQSAGLA